MHQFKKNKTKFVTILAIASFIITTIVFCGLKGLTSIQISFFVYFPQIISWSLLLFLIVWNVWDRLLWKAFLKFCARFKIPMRKDFYMLDLSGRWKGDYKRGASASEQGEGNAVSDGKNHGFVIEISQTASMICCST
ncbi:MAG: hypothetical protein FWG53_09080 [Clostridiales bacterium]|nr:hypothetical protein [Clostridiales bacterium]